MAENTGKFYIGTDTRVTIQGIKNELQQFLTGSDTITGVLSSVEDDAIVVGAESIPFTYVTDSDGDFFGYIPAEAELVAKKKYKLVLTVDHNSRQMTIVVTREAVYITA
jgi:hypothetical protein